jgi:ribosomal protein L7/L12
LETSNSPTVLTVPEIEAMLRITTAQVTITKEVEGVNLDDLCRKLLQMHEEAANDPNIAARFPPRALTVKVQYSNNKVGAIKLVRMITGRGLKEAKDICDAASYDYRSERHEVIMPGIPREAFAAAQQEVQFIGGVWIFEHN